MRQTGEANPRSLGLGPFGEVLTVTSFIVTRLHPHLSLKLRKSSVCNMREAPCADFDCDEIKCVIRFCCSCMLPLMQKPWQTNSTTDIPIFMHVSQITDPVHEAEREFLPFFLYWFRSHECSSVRSALVVAVMWQPSRRVANWRAS